MAKFVEVTEAGRGKFAVDIAAGVHHLISDEPEAAGGNDLGPDPHAFILAGLGACTVMTLRLYADRKKMRLTRIAVKLSRRKLAAADCSDCRTKEGEVEEITRVIAVEGELDEAERARLLEIADRCPVHRTLTGEIKVRTTLAGG
jgi:putative redox protein